MVELTTLVPRGIIDDSRQSHPLASTRLVILVATGILNGDHPWKPHAPRIAAHAGRVFIKELSLVQRQGEVTVSVPLVVLMLQEVGVLSNVEFKNEGFVVHQNHAWLEYQLARPPEAQFRMLHYAAERSQWNAEQAPDVE